MEKLNLKKQKTIVKFWLFEYFRLIFGVQPLVLGINQSKLRKDSNASKRTLNCAS